MGIEGQARMAGWKAEVGSVCGKYRADDSVVAGECIYNIFYKTVGREMLPEGR